MPALDRIEALSLILTSRCNLRCGYCYQSPKRPRRAAWSTIRASLDLVLGGSRRDIGIGFSGGEPLLEFPLMRRAVAHVEKNRPARKTVTYYVSTNGTLLTEEIAGFLEEHGFETQLSFDGVAASQNMRGRDTFSSLDRLLDRLRKKHADFYRQNVAIALTVTPRNLEHLAGSVAYFMRKKAARIVIAPSVASDGDWKIGRIDELDAQLGRIFRRSLAHYRRTGEIPVQLFRGGGEDSVRARARPLMCGLSNGRGIAVDVDGRVYGCSMFAGSYTKLDSPLLRGCVAGLGLGRIDDPGLARRFAAFPAAVRRARMFHRKDRKRSAYGRCAGCKYLARCFVCPSSIGFVPGNGDPDRVSDLCCAFNMVSLKYRERFPREPDMSDFVLPLPWINARRASSPSGRER
jgi:sulfatase maturation enzyme AslB (radical SAM superfamily)